MNTSTIEQKALEKREWLQGVADHTIEQAVMDPQSNYAFRMAEKKLAAIDRSLRRINLGVFGRCDECGGPIEKERWEFLIDSDYHVCAQCAATLAVRKRYRSVSRQKRSSYGYLNAAMEMA